MPDNTPSTPSPTLKLSRPQPRARRGGLIPLSVAGIICVSGLAFVAYRYAWPRPVVIVNVAPGIMPYAITGPATLDALEKANLGSRISGQLRSTLVDLNDRVVQGQLLGSIEQTDLRAQVAAAQANLEAARSGEMEARAALAGAKANLENEKGIFDRQATLYAQGWVSKANYDQTAANFNSAVAEVEARNRAVSQAAAQVGSVEAQGHASSAVLGMSELRSPFDGVVTARNMNVGDLLTPGDAVFQIVRPETLIFRARFDESAIGNLRPGQAAVLAFGSGGPDIAGSVLRISREVDPETREFTADVLPQRLPPNWALNQRATVTVTTEVRKNVVAVRSDCIVWRKKVAGVWQVRDGRAHWRKVTPGVSANNLVEIRFGLSNGQVICGARHIYAFMPVVREAER